MSQQFLDNDLDFIKTVLNDSNENFYIVDLEDYGLVQIDEKPTCNKISKCYSAIYGLDKACHECLNRFLAKKLDKTDKTIKLKKEVYDHKNNKWYIRREKAFKTPSGKKYKLVFKNDITNSKKSTKKLKIDSHKNKKLDEVLIDQLPDAFVIVDQSGTILKYNNKFVRLLSGESTSNYSYQEKNILNKNIFKFIKNRDKGIFRRMFENRDNTMTIGIINQEKNILKTRVNIQKYNDLYYIIIRDNTTFLADNEIDSKLQKLATMGEMVTSIAHQWKQPLNVLNLSTYLLAETENIDDRKELYTKISEIINSMSMTIEDFREFYRPSKKSELFSAKDAIHTSTNMLKASLTNNHISLNIEIGNDFKLVGKKSEFIQVLMIIFNNSIDSLKLIDDFDMKKIQITIDNNSISIRDCGVGISKKNISKIFNPTYTTKKDGTGIGLYMAKNIVDKMKYSLKAVRHDIGVEFIIE